MLELFVLNKIANQKENYEKTDHPVVVAVKEVSNQIQRDNTDMLYTSEMLAFLLIFFAIEIACIIHAIKKYSSAKPHKLVIALLFAIFSPFGYIILSSAGLMCDCPSK